MKSRHSSRLTRYRLFGMIILFAVVGCKSAAPENPAIQEVTWQHYANHTVGVSLSYPDIYTVDEDADVHGALFRYGGHPVISLRRTDEHQGKKHGLWFGHKPDKSIQLGGRDGLRYLYDHYDGPFYMRTISYVVELEDDYVGLEFRTENEELDEIQNKILTSFKFE